MLHHVLTLLDVLTLVAGPTACEVLLGLWAPHPIPLKSLQPIQQPLPPPRSQAPSPPAGPGAQDSGGALWEVGGAGARGSGAALWEVGGAGARGSGGALWEAGGAGGLVGWLVGWLVGCCCEVLLGLWAPRPAPPTCSSRWVPRHTFCRVMKNRSPID